MNVIRVTEHNVDDAVQKASALIRDGGIVAFPTETFYGIGTHYADETALRRIYTLKQRSTEHALPLLIGSKKLLKLVTPSIHDIAAMMMNRFWPGPLTILFPARSNLHNLITAGTEKVAVRMPGGSIGLRLAQSLEFPITATSANISGMPPAENADQVFRYFKDGIDLLIDGGSTSGTLPSTIIDIIDNKIIIVRQGVIPKADILHCS
ncbi:MAG: threonylcarbamoyl-AMP synthase [Nitrospiraceae bacterium]|nr:MAG: threonylcarbamoyl-AMP synthase [Nitrospiraceae bacterium]